MDKFVPGKAITETLRDSMKVPCKKAKMIAHRGLSGLELENTNAAFVAAGQRSFYGIETDTQRTKDGHFIAFHDGELDRMMGVSIKICDITLEELRKYQMKDFWEKRKRSFLALGEYADGDGPGRYTDAHDPHRGVACRHAEWRCGHGA